MLEAIRKTVKRPAVVAILAMVIVTAGLSLSRFGTYLDDFLYFQPVMQLRAALGRQPKLSDKLRVVLLDDKSLQQLGRHPSFAEWDEIAALLAREGIERTILVGMHSLPAELGKTTDGAPGHRLALGAVVTNDSSNFRSSTFRGLSSDLFVPGESPPGAPVAERAMLPAAGALRRGWKLGHLNISSNFKVPAYYQVGPGLALPNIGLLAAASLRFEHGTLYADGQAVPTSPGFQLYVDYVDRLSLVSQALPVSAFFTADRSSVRKTVYPRLRARLQGGRVAILVPDAYTGSRFLDSPYGKVLSYMALASVANSTLTGRFLYQPAPWRDLLLLYFLATGLVLCSRRAKTALTVGGGLSLALPAACALALICVGLVLPCSAVTLGLCSGWLARAAFQSLAAAARTAALNKELEFGAVIQKTILPTSNSGAFGQWEYFVHYKPYGAMAGDWFQVSAVEADGQEAPLVVAIGDGVGKGPSAALNTAVIAGVWNNELESWKKGDFDVPRLLHALDRTIRQTFAGEQNTTLSLAVLGGEKAEVTCCSAPAWVHLFQSAQGIQGKSLRMKPNNPLGMNQHGTLKPVSMDVPLAEGDLLVAYTDGVMDGYPAFLAFLRSLASESLDRPPQELFQLILAKALEAGKKSALPDDQTILVIRRRRASEMSPALAS